MDTGFNCQKCLKKLETGPGTELFRMHLNSQATDSKSGVTTITPKIQLCVGDTEKLSVTFSHA